MLPAYEDPSTIPYLSATHCTKLKMTNTRKKQLLKAANRGLDDPPIQPRNDECCGSSCTPCVKDLWKEDVLVWKQRWGLQEDDAITTDQSSRSSRKDEITVCSSKVPGSFDW